MPLRNVTRTNRGKRTGTTPMIEAKLLLTVLLMATIQLVAHFGARAKP
jgi:hypothetical protein